MEGCCILKNRFVLISLCCAVFFTVILIWVLTGSKESYPVGTISYTLQLSGLGLSPAGIADAGNWGSNAQFYDFESGEIVPFCEIPSCKHEDNGCFAWSLANSEYGEIQQINLYNNTLFFLALRNDFSVENPYYLVLCSSSVSGSSIKELYTFPDMDSCTNMTIADGKVFLTLKKANQEASQHNNMDYDSGVVGWYDLKSGKFVMLPEKTGYGNNISFLGYTDGKVLYRHSYQTEPFELEIDTFADSEKLEYFVNISRFTYWYADIENVQEEPWSSDYFEVVGSRYSGREIFVSPNAIHQFTHQWGDEKYTVDIRSYSIVSRDMKNTFSITLRTNTNLPNAVIYSDYLYFAEYDSSGNVIALTLIDNSNGEQILLNEFSEYVPTAQIGSKVVLLSYQDNQTVYSWIELEDLLASRNDLINTFSRS